MVKEKRNPPVKHILFYSVIGALGVYGFLDYLRPPEPVLIDGRNIVELMSPDEQLGQIESLTPLFESLIESPSLREDHFPFTR